MSLAVGLGAGIAIGMGAGLAAGRKRTREAVLEYVRREGVTLQARDGRALDPEEIFEQAFESDGGRDRRVQIALIIVGVLGLIVGVVVLLRVI